MRLEVRWDRTDPQNPGWYVQLLEGDALLTDSVKVDFPVDVDRFARNCVALLIAALREAFPGVQIAVLAGGAQ